MTSKKQATYESRSHLDLGTQIGLQYNLPIFNQQNMLCRVNGFYNCSPEKSECHTT